MTADNVLDKVRKLLRLGQSSNANEAALATAKAQELIDRHKLSTAILALDDAAPTKGLDDEPIQDFDQAPLDTPKRLDRWRVVLSTTIAYHNDCKVYSQGSDLKIVGRASDAETVRYLYGWLSREVERLTTEAGNGMGRTWRNNFRLGVCETVSRKLREQREAFEKTVRAEAKAQIDAAPGSLALVRVNQALARSTERKMEVVKWTKENMSLRSSSPSPSRYDSNARAAGRRAGESINISGGRRGLASGARKLTA